jgi:hypothetical protein
MRGINRIYRTVTDKINDCAFSTLLFPFLLRLLLFLLFISFNLTYLKMKFSVCLPTNEAFLQVRFC